MPGGRNREGEAKHVFVVVVPFLKMTDDEYVQEIKNNSSDC